ncbi:oxidoreductase [Rhizobium sp. 2MFCol3.1]|uniref:oxidoreductase n=1 Tax=Rhizobium sp. 2MFCol3.1 TaxID=1246459 RepID=UPI0003610563|nr:oxidoreductase [Rhizobium sp. 2MFCol3.1]
MTKSTWLITGCSSGLGRELARAVLASGANAIVTARNSDTLADIVADYPGTARALSLDVTDRDQVLSVVSAGIETFGSIDVLVNNAGYAYRSAVEEGDEREVTDLFATNFFGAVSMIKAVLPAMRSRRHGCIVNVSSIGGRFSGPASGYYSATKFAMEGLSDALRKELGAFGCKVVLVEPGALRTDFAGRSLHGSSKPIADYERVVGHRRVGADKSSGSERGDPRKAAEAIISAVAAENAPFRLLLGSDAIEIIRNELTGQMDELERWALLSVSIDMDEAPGVERAR